MAIVESGFIKSPRPDFTAKSRPVQTSSTFRAPLTYSVTLSISIYLSEPFHWTISILVYSLSFIQQAVVFQQGKSDLCLFLFI